MFGRKGDRRIRLIEKDSRKGVPTIEVIKNDTKSGPYIDKIFYEKKKKSRK